MNRAMVRVFLLAAMAGSTAAATACNFGGNSGGPQDGGVDRASANAVLVATPPAVDFGTVSAPGQSASKQIVILNSGAGTTGALAAALSGTGAKAFAIDADGCTDRTLALDDVCAIGVHFAPQATGAASAALTVSGDPGGDVVVALTGNGGGTSALSIDPAVKDLGSLGVGATSTAVVFTVTNHGSATTSGPVSVSLTGSDASQFSLSANQCADKSLQPSATCTVAVSAAPTSAGVKAATLVAQSAGDPGMATSSLSATALPPAAFAVTPATYDFGPAVQGGPPGSGQTFTVKNVGGVPSQAPTVAVSGPNQADFAVSSNTCTSALPALAECTFVLTFAPSTVGPETAGLSVSATDATSGQAMATGTGLAPSAIGISPTSQDFGPLVQGAPPGSDVPFLVTNTGGVATGTLAASLVGTNADQFGLGTDGCTGHTLAPNASCTVNAHFAPTATGTVGALQASLQVSGTPGGTTAAALTATSIAPAALAIAPAQPLGTVVQGSIGMDFPFQVTNSGGDTTGAITVALGGASKADFGLGTDGCTGKQLAHGDSCTVYAHYAPGAGAAASEQATLTVSATPGGNAVANLTASSLAPASIAFDTMTVPFGGILQGGQATPVKLTLTNSGGVDSGPVTLTPGGPNPGQFAFTQDTCTKQTLAANGGSCTVYAAFAPSTGTRGTQTATLTATASPGGSAPVTVTGTAQAPAAISLSQPTLPEWSNVPVGTTSAPVSFTVSNLGDVASSAITYAFLGKGFGIVAPNPCTGPVQPGTPCTFQMTFTPFTAAGTTSATVTANATTGGQSTANLQGTALWVLTVTVQNDPGPNAPCGSDVIGGNVTTSPTGINCTMTGNPAINTNTCTANFANNAALTLTETGSNFESWAGCTEPKGVPINAPTCPLTMVANTAVTATWCGPIP